MNYGGEEVVGQETPTVAIAENFYNIFIYFFFIVVPRLPGTGQTVDEDLLNEQTIPTLPTAGSDC